MKNIPISLICPICLILAAAPSAQADDWGTITGRIVFAGDELPKPKNLEITKDQDHCLASGPLADDKWTVNAGNKGVRWVVVFLKPERGKKLAVHPNLKNGPMPDVVLEQPQCKYIPHVFAMQKSQKLIATNTAPVAHSVKITGLINQFNINVPPGGKHEFKLRTERNAVQIGCGIHPWMVGYAWIFDHPYFAVTDENGNFEIKNAPAGSHTLMVWHEAVGYIGGRKGKTIAISAGDNDLGEIDLKPK